MSDQHMGQVRDQMKQFDTYLESAKYAMEKTGMSFGQIAVSTLSDVQELLDLGETERANNMINAVKYLLIKGEEEKLKTPWQLIG